MRVAASFSRHTNGNRYRGLAVSYLEFLNLLFSLGAKLKDKWPLILAVYNAVKELYEAFGEPTGAPSDGTLAVHSFSPDELDAEERVLALIQDGDKQQLNLASLYQIFMLLKSSGLLDRFLGKFRS